MSNRPGMAVGMDLDLSDRDNFLESLNLPRGIERRLDRQMVEIKHTAESVMVTVENQGRISCSAAKRAWRLVTDLERLLSLVNDEEMTPVERVVCEEIARNCLEQMDDTVSDSHRGLLRELARATLDVGNGRSRRALLEKPGSRWLSYEEDDG